MNEAVEILYGRYAQALYEIAEHKDAADRVMLELESVNELWISDKHFRTFLAHPFVSHQEKRAIVEHMFGKAHYSNIVVNFIKTLADNNRGNLIHGIFLKYRDIYESKKDKVRVFVESPQSLSDNQKDKLGEAFRKKLNKKIILETRVNPDLIGGLHIRYKDKVYDNSIGVQLNRLKEVMA